MDPISACSVSVFAFTPERADGSCDRKQASQEPQGRRPQCRILERDQRHLGRRTADKLEDGLNAATVERRSIDNASHHDLMALYWYLFGGLISRAFLLVYSAMGPAVFGVAASYAPLADHVAVAIMLSAFILVFQNLAYIAINKKMIDDSVTFLNLQLVAAVLVCLVFLSAFFQTWYTLPLALGMFSIVTGFALQPPLCSLVGWVYILFSKPYRVGDRIRIGGAIGDVIDVSHFDTTLWEFG